MKKKYPKNYIKELREARGMSLEDVAQAVGVTNPYVSMLEQGKRGLSWMMLRKLADAFQCNPLEITEGTSRPEEPRNRQEKEMLRKFRGLADGEREMFSYMLDSFASGKNTKKKK